MKADAAGALVTLLTVMFAPPHWAEMTTLVACTGGAYASFAFGDPVEPRSRMAKVFVACIIMGWAFSVILNAIIGAMFEDVVLTSSFRAAVGAVMSCIMRFWLPSLIEKLKSGAWTAWIPFLNRKGE